jgi:hypothetical protein
MADADAVQPLPGEQRDAKRRRQELTEVEQVEALRMLLPKHLSFKLRQASGPVHPRTVKARVSCLMQTPGGALADNSVCRS